MDSYRHPVTMLTTSTTPCVRAARRRWRCLMRCFSPEKKVQRQRNRSATVLLLACMSIVSIASSQALTVTTPVGGLEVGQDFTVEWVYADSSGTTGDLNAFSIDLRRCESNKSSCSANGVCGHEYASLCEREDGCMDSDGSYNVQIPQDIQAGFYFLSVELRANASVSACSEVLEVSTQSSGTTIKNSSYLEALIPDYVEAGDAFTARWKYDNGVGESAGTFEIDLYSCIDGACDSGGCGEFSVSLCEAPGCYDPGPGDYDVRIPADQDPGAYKLRVKNVEDSTTHCSEGTFFVTAYGESGNTLPPEKTPAEGTPTPSEAPVSTTGAPFNPSPQPTSGYAPSPAPLTPPDLVPEKVNCDPDAELSFVPTVESNKMPLVTVAHASGDGSEAGCLTLTKLWEYLSSQPEGVPTDLLYTVDPTTSEADVSLTASPTGMWLLKTSILVTNGVTFKIYGMDNAGGDCDELKISSTGLEWYRIMGHGGNIDIRDTWIRSWNEFTMMEHVLDDDDSGKEPRSYITCISEVADPDESCEGVSKNDMGECRMDIVNSELGYLGYNSAESYGLTWKVRGLCVDLSNRDLFDNVRVYGDIINSNIHHMWFGMYSYGHLGGVWANNLMHDNHVYGFDPHDDSDYLTIRNNTCYNNGNHGIIASKRCDHLLVADNNCFDNGGSGIMLHKSCDDSIVSGNTCSSNVDGGLSLVETSRTLVTGNTFEYNRWGFRVLLGSTNNTLVSNTLIENTVNDIYAYIGAAEDVPDVAPFTGINVNNTFHQNEVHHVTKDVVDIEDSTHTVISENTFTGAGGRMKFLRSHYTHVVRNSGGAANGDDQIASSCFTEESDRLPICS